MCYKKLMKMVAQATGQIYFVNKRLRKNSLVSVMVCLIKQLF